MTSNELSCWCCGQLTAADRVVHLGAHPEVALCVGCALWAGKQARAIEDRGVSGPFVLLRTMMRSARTTVIEHGWHRQPLIGAALRRLGRYTP